VVITYGVSVSLHSSEHVNKPWWRRQISSGDSADHFSAIHVLKAATSEQTSALLIRHLLFHNMYIRSSLMIHIFRFI